MVLSDLCERVTQPQSDPKVENHCTSSWERNPPPVVSKGIKEDTNSWVDIPCSWSRRPHHIKNVTKPNVSYCGLRLSDLTRF